MPLAENCILVAVNLRDGTVKFVYTNADYKTRAAMADLMAAAKAAL